MKSKHTKLPNEGAIKKNTWDKIFPIAAVALGVIALALTVVIILVKCGAFDPKPEDLSAYAPDVLSEEIHSSGAFDYVLLKDGSAMVVGFSENAGEVNELIFPSEIDGKRVSAIADKSFYLEMTVARVVIPEGVTYIGSEAFYGCVRLEMLSLPTTLAVIREGAFNFCDYLNGISYAGTHDAWKNVKVGVNNSALGYVLALG